MFFRRDGNPLRVSVHHAVHNELSAHYALHCTFITSPPYTCGRKDERSDSLRRKRLFVDGQRSGGHSERRKSMSQIMNPPPLAASEIPTTDKVGKASVALTAKRAFL